MLVHHSEGPLSHAFIFRYLNMFFHTVDGNFHSTQKMKPMDPPDFSLMNAAGYCVEEKEFLHF